MDFQGREWVSQRKEWLEGDYVMMLCYIKDSDAEEEGEREEDKEADQLFISTKDWGGQKGAEVT